MGHPDILDAQQKEITKLNDPQINNQSGKDNRNCKSNEQLKTYSQLIQEQNNITGKFSRDTKQKRSGRIVPIPNIPLPPTSQPNIIGHHGSSNTSTTDLSTITSKFKVAKPNPFENLLKLSSKPGGKSMIGDGFTALSAVHETVGQDESIQNDKGVEA